ncbi:MAG: hypothetical protein AAB413_01175 [Patescibacteria group bacterium]
MGLVYLLAPNHLPYHHTVIEVLGERVLDGKLLELLLVCGMGVGMADVCVMQMRPTTLIFPHAILALGGMMVALSASPPGRTLVVRRCAGFMVLLLCTAEFILLIAASRMALLTSGAIAGTLVVYVTLGTRKLGRQASAKTPWPLLAALCLPFIVGTALAFLA